MTRPVRILAAALTATALAGAALGRDAPADAAENLWVKAEPDPAGGAAGRVQAGIDIPAPPSVVWLVMLDCARAPAFVPKLKACSVVEGDAARGSDIREHRLAGPFGTVRNVFRSTYVRERSITTARVGGDLKVAEGVWRLQPIDGGAGTRVAYDSRLALNAPVPGAMVRGALRKDTLLVLRALRREAIAAAG